MEVVKSNRDFCLHSLRASKSHRLVTMEKSQPQPSSDLYGIARDSAESERLNRQHKILTTNLGFLLYPGVERQLSDTPKIADLGTGTGIWLLDLAKQRAGSRGL